MGNLVADAMRAKYLGVEAAITNSGGLRQDILIAPPTAGEQPGQITWGEVFAVLPFGNRTVIETLTGAQLQAALLNGVSPACDPNVATGRFPQVSGVSFAYNPALPRMHRVLEAKVNGQPLDPVRIYRVATIDFLRAGGDGYASLTRGKSVVDASGGQIMAAQVIDYLTSRKTVEPLIEGRIEVRR